MPTMDTTRLISLEEARELLAPYTDRIASCIQAGWERWEELGKESPKSQLPLRPSTRASFVYDHIVDAARQEFVDDHPEVVLADVHGFLTLTIKDRVVLRFKKYRSDSLRTSGIRNAQQQRFELQMQLPGMPPQATKLVAGYLLDELQTSISLMAVTCVDGPSLEWALDITVEADQEAATVEPIRPVQPGGPRIKPKAPAEADEGDASRGT